MLLNSDPNRPDLVLVNPAAGGGRSKEALPRLREFAEQRGWAVEFCITESAEELAARAREAAAAGRKRLFVLGGDGTFQVLLNAVAENPHVVLGILPAGGGNDVASALGLPPDPLRAAELLFQADVCFFDVVCVRTADGVERFYAGGGGLGLDAEAVVHTTGVYRNMRGRARYLFSAIRALMGFQSIRVRARIHPATVAAIDAQVLLLGILNTPSYGAGLRLAPKARTDDGVLDLVLLEDRSFFEALRMLPALAVHGELRARRIQRYQIECARIETDRPCPFHGDGEIIGCTPLEVAVKPRAVRVLRPRASVFSS
jgi:diacylglycerol kinase (ATP)